MKKLYTFALTVLISTAGQAMETAKDFDYAAVKIAKYQSKIQHFMNKQEIMEKVTGNTDSKYCSKIAHYQKKLDFFLSVKHKDERIDDLKDFAHALIQSTPVTLEYFKEKMKITPTDLVEKKYKASSTQTYTHLVTHVNQGLSKEIASNTKALLNTLGLSIAANDTTTNKSLTYSTIIIEGQDIERLDKLFDKVCL